MADDHPNHYLRAMHASTTQAELAQVALEIDYDRWEELPWTKDEAAMNRLRNFYAWKKERVK